MSKKTSYMDSKNVLKESFLDDLIDQFFPKLKKGSTERYLNKPKIKKKLAKYEKQLKDLDKKSKQTTKNFEKALGKELGKKVEFGNLSVADILKGKHIKG